MFLKESYFASPRYVKSHKDKRTVDGDDGPYTEWTNVWDGKDAVDAWLHKNSLGPVRNQAKMSHNLRHHLFMGIEGVLCEICVSPPVYEADAVTMSGGGGAKEGPYRKFIKIRSMPLGRVIPEELTQKLDAEGFEFVQNDSADAKRILGSFD